MRCMPLQQRNQAVAGNASAVGAEPERTQARSRTAAWSENQAVLARRTRHDGYAMMPSSRPCRGRGANRAQTWARSALQRADRGRAWVAGPGAVRLRESAAPLLTPGTCRALRNMRWSIRQRARASPKSSAWAERADARPRAAATTDMLSDQRDTACPAARPEMCWSTASAVMSSERAEGKSG